MSIELAVILTGLATWLMVLTYTYLYLQYRQRYLAKWVAAWVLHGFRMIFLEKTFLDQSSPLLSILYVAISFAYCLFMINAAMEFAGKPFRNGWSVAGVLCLIISVAGILLHAPPAYYEMPAVVFVGTTYIVSGVVIHGIPFGGMGKLITTAAFILLGAHTLDMPFLLPFKWFVPWGYLMDGMFRFLAAIGIVFVYLEKVRADLDKQEKYYRLLAENATDVIYRFRLTGSGSFEYISPSVKQLTGRDPGDFKTIRHVIRVIHPEDRQRFGALLRAPALFDGFATLRLYHKSGDIVWAEQKYSMVADSEGKPVAVEGIVRDVTKRVLLEQDVSRLDRLNIAGQMAANLAHEVRNPLTTIRGYLQLLGNKHEFERYKGQLGMLLEELDRTNHIITEYLSLSKDKIVDMKKCSLNNIIQSIYPLLQSDAVSSKIEVRLLLGMVPELLLDDKEIKQLVINLTRNAIEAMPEGGRLEIVTRASGEDIILSIKDQGAGIPPQVLDNLGKPFLTTKESGTGLGMAICYRIADRHSARLNIETGSAGTTVHVMFRNR